MREVEGALVESCGWSSSFEKQIGKKLNRGGCMIACGGHAKIWDDAS